MGVGQSIRSTFRAFCAVGAPPKIRDIYGLEPKTDDGLWRELGEHLSSELKGQVNIFHINGDEVEGALARIGGLPDAVNVIYPMWELSCYPDPWVQKLELFDEIWAPSRFVFEAIAAKVKKRVLHMPLACEVHPERFMGRRYFGIPEAGFVFLFFFDFTSYVQRKHPFAVLEAFQRLLQELPHTPARLIVKLNHGVERPEDHRQFLHQMERLREHVVLIDRVLQDDEIKNLVRCCDCFVSLHRSEGFGLGMAEAMYLGKPVIATGYSGNLEFMTEENSVLVAYRPVPVHAGQYPYGEGQVWAEPDMDHAVRGMRRVLEDREYADSLGWAGSRHLRVHFSYRARGLCYLERVRELA